MKTLLEPVAVTLLVAGMFFCVWADEGFRAACTELRLFFKEGAR